MIEDPSEFDNYIDDDDVQCTCFSDTNVGVNDKQVEVSVINIEVNDFIAEVSEPNVELNDEKDEVSEPNIKLNDLKYLHTPNIRFKSP